METLVFWMFSSHLMFFPGLIPFKLNCKYLLPMLLGLFFYLDFFCGEIYFSMSFVSMGVCEGALGLSIWVSLVRTHGGNNF